MNRFAKLAVLLVVALPAAAADYTWNVPQTAPSQTGDWSLADNWIGGPVGTAPGADPLDTAIIDNRLPSPWSTGDNTTGLQIRIDTPLTMKTLTVVDATLTNNSAVILRINKNLTLDTLNWDNDPAGRGRSWFQIGQSGANNGAVLYVNTVNVTSRFPDKFIGSGSTATGQQGIWRWKPDANGKATYGYQPRGDGDYLGAHMLMDFSEVTTMEWSSNLNTVNPIQEARDFYMLVGNASADQFWTIGGLGSGAVRMISRGTGTQWAFYKNGSNTVDMGVRPAGDANGESRGVKVERNTSGDHWGVGVKRLLFTTPTGDAAAGTVKIAAYTWHEAGRDGTAANGAAFMYDKLGSDLEVNGGNLYLQPRLSDNARCEDVTAFWVLPGKSVAVKGAANEILVDRSGAVNAAGRSGILFEGGTIASEGNLRVLGATTFLNGGATGGTIKVGGNVIIESANPAGNSALKELTTGMTATADDFNLTTSIMELNGDTQTLTWNTAYVAAPPLPVAGDFSQDNFALGTLKLTTTTSVNFTTGTKLYLGSDLLIEDGSVLNMPENAAIYLLDPDHSELARLRGYVGTKIVGAKIQKVDGVGELIAWNAVAAVPGDANGDSKVDFADYLILESSYGSAPGGATSDADFDDNGVVEFADYLVLEANFGTGAVPEPATLTLLGLAALGLIRRRK